MKNNNFKSVLITGCSKGIGLELVSQFLESNSIERVFAGTKCRSEVLERLKQKYPKQLEILEMDVTDPSLVTKCYDTVRQKVDSLDLIVNNAGIMGNQIDRPINEVQSKELLDVFKTDVCGALNVTNTFFPLFRKDSKTIVVNFSSSLGSIGRLEESHKTDQNIFIGYRVANSGLNMLTKCYSFELGEKATFVAINPGWTDTDLGNLCGKKPPTSCHESVCKVMKQIYSVGEDRNGHLIDNEGKDIPW